MNNQVLQFYAKSSVDEGHPFYEVIFLDEEMTWDTAHSMSPSLPKGWFEIANIDLESKIHLTEEFWLSKLPFTPLMQDKIVSFFQKVDDIGVFLTKIAPDSPFEVEMVYSIENNRGFFRGRPPLQDVEIRKIAGDLNDVMPSDYLHFFSIHNGFSKNDDFGIFLLENIKNHMEWFQKNLLENHKSVFCANRPIDPKMLIPFYESKDLMQTYQCFYLDWLFGKEVGNVFYQEQKISDFHNPRLWEENLSYPTFFHWLIDYLTI